jgi:hypothetical protein
VALGLLGKVLGPIGWVLTTRSGEWPLRTFSLIVFNDLIWWLPFALFLLEGTRLGARVRAAAPYVCAGLNGLAGLALLTVLRPGTEAVADPALRAAYIAQNAAAWRAGWLLWMAAALSLLGFYAWWGSLGTGGSLSTGGARLTRPGWGLAAIGLAMAGLVCDLFAESLYVGWLPEHLAELQRAASLLSGGAANGLYTAAGITLTLASPWLRGPLRLWAWSIWVSGMALSVTTVASFAPGMIASGAALMTLFVPFAAVMGWRYGAPRLPEGARRPGIKARPAR